MVLPCLTESRCIWLQVTENLIQTDETKRKFIFHVTRSPEVELLRVFNQWLCVKGPDFFFFGLLLCYLCCFSFPFYLVFLMVARLWQLLCAYCIEKRPFLLLFIFIYLFFTEEKFSPKLPYYLRLLRFLRPELCHHPTPQPVTRIAQEWVVEFHDTKPIVQLYSQSEWWWASDSLSLRFFYWWIGDTID